MWKRRAGKLSLVVAGSLGLTVPAVADESASAPIPTVAPQPAPAGRSYAYQILLNDAAAAGLMTSRTGLPIGLGAMVIGPSLIHALRGNGSAAAWGFVFRVGLPAGLGTAGYYLESCPDGRGRHGCGTNSALGGAVLGLAIAAFIDVMMANESPKEPAPARVAPPEKQPMVSFDSAGIAPLRDGGASVLVSGRF